MLLDYEDHWYYCIFVWQELFFLKLIFKYTKLAKENPQILIIADSVSENNNVFKLFTPNLSRCEVFSYRNLRGVTPHCGILDNTEKICISIFFSNYFSFTFWVGLIWTSRYVKSMLETWNFVYFAASNFFSWLLSVQLV